MSSPQDELRVRVDKWLWAARFFKTRALASVSVEGGKVQINGERAKPSRQLHCGDELRIQKGPETFVIDVLVLATQRGSAERARALYNEQEASITARATLREERRLQIASEPVPGGRPDKRSRREWQRLRGR